MVVLITKKYSSVPDGEMKTLVDDCEFVLVEHKDFCSIMSTVQDHIERDTDGVTGEVTAEHERRSLGSQSGAVIIKAKVVTYLTFCLQRDLGGSADSTFGGRKRQQPRPSLRRRLPSDLSRIHPRSDSYLREIDASLRRYSLQRQGRSSHFVHSQCFRWPD